MNLSATRVNLTERHGWAAAEQEYKRAAELDPNYAPAHE
jgi:hypothetical protein